MEGVSLGQRQSVSNAAAISHAAAIGKDGDGAPDIVTLGGSATSNIVR
jgi:hypothetical protein